MIVEFWGTRAGIALAAPSPRRYGGDTACVTVRSSRGDIFIFDSGTGVVAFGASQKIKGASGVRAFFSGHSWDRVQGIPFFAPMFRPDFQVDYYALDTEESTLAKVLQTQMQYEFFPVSFCDLQARSAFHTFTSRNTGTVKLDVPDTEGTSVTAIRLHKHEPRAAYRLNCNGKVIVYAVNVDWGHAYPSLDRLASFVSGADLLITNIPREHEGWRSSDDERAFVQLYRRAHIARTVVSDFSPSLDDNTITAYIQRTREQVSSIDSNHNQRIQAAYTNLRIIL